MKNKIDREQEVYKRLHAALQKEGKPFFAGNLLVRAAQLYPERTALIFQDHTITYQELFKQARYWQLFLAQKGVKPGDRILILCQNSPLFYIGYFAAWQLGAVVTPLNIFLKEAELRHIIADAQPTAAFTDAEYASLFQSDPNETIHIITDDMVNGVTYSESTYEYTYTEYDYDALTVLVYTSGTTGTPKGVMLSSRNIITNICQVIARLQTTEHERLFAALPLFHVFAQVTSVWISIYLGATVILVPKIERHAILQGLQQKPTMFIGIPALYGLLCMLRTAPLDSVKLFVSGGDALPDKIRMLFALIYNRKIVNGYGLSEASPVIAVDYDDALSYTNTVGKPLVEVECAIKQDDKTDAPLNVSGRLFVQGNNVMLGYYNAPDATAAVLQNGWLDTGDCAYICKSGKLVITGREKDLIINKGFNIYPQEIENIILTHPQVLRAAVVGQKDEQVGEVPVAFVQLRTNMPTIEQELRALCMHHLATYKIPRAFICSSDELPLTATGKVDKKVLRTKL